METYKISAITKTETKITAPVTAHQDETQSETKLIILYIMRRCVI